VSPPPHIRIALLSDPSDVSVIILDTVLSNIRDPSIFKSPLGFTVPEIFAYKVPVTSASPVIFTVLSV
jgi:hypothetical protein